MKRILSLAFLAACAATLSNCRSPQPPPPPVVVHHYHETTRTVKSGAVSGSSSPEGFQAVTPPSSYSR